MPPAVSKAVATIRAPKYGRARDARFNMTAALSDRFSEPAAQARAALACAAGSYLLVLFLLLLHLVGILQSVASLDDEQRSILDRYRLLLVGLQAEDLDPVPD